MKKFVLKIKSVVKDKIDIENKLKLVKNTNIDLESHIGIKFVKILASYKQNEVLSYEQYRFIDNLLVRDLERREKVQDNLKDEEEDEFINLYLYNNIFDKDVMDTIEY